MTPPPTIYVIAGCNGAGKTTFARAYLPTEVKCLRFLNPDEIARGISPLAPEAGAIKAARILLNEFHDHVRSRLTFAIESTLSGKTYLRHFRAAREAGYEIELHYLWISGVEQAIARVRRRVRLGGHAVPIADIRRRFGRSLFHFANNYLPLATSWVLWNNSGFPTAEMASSPTHSIESVRRLISL